MVFTVNFRSLTGDVGTVIVDVGLQYSNKLNRINEAIIKLSGSTVVKRELIQTGAEAYIYRNGVLEFRGIIDNKNVLPAGAMVIHVAGYEAWLAKPNGAFASSPWKSVASSTIFSQILAESSKLTVGTIDTGSNVYFRATDSDTLWNAISNLREKTNQDISIDYTTSTPTISILNNKGSGVSLMTLNAGIEMTNPSITESTPLGNKVIVYGKGDGATQILSSYPAHGYNASSQVTYGLIFKKEVAPEVASVDEANLLADSLVEVYSLPVKIYAFDISNPNLNLTSGDVITLNVPSQGITNEDVRIVGTERGHEAGNEFLRLEVTNIEYSRLLKNRNQILAQIDKTANDQATYMQGTTNILTFSQMINANNTAPLSIISYFPQAVIFDEMNQRRVESCTLDFDIDPFRSNVSSASSTGTHATGLGINNASSYANGGITNTVKGASDTGYTFGRYTYTLSDTGGSWTNVNYVNTGSPTYLFHATSVSFSSQQKGGPIVSVRLYNLTTGEYFPSSDGVFLGGFPISSLITYWWWGSTTMIVPKNWSNTRYYLQYSYYSGGVTALGTIYYTFVGTEGHTHANSYSDSTHTNANSLSDPSHNHSVVIGDATSDAGLINATGVSIYFDYWDGVNWVNKYSTSISSTLQFGIDLTNGGTLPDTYGYWRTRIFTNAVTPDLIQGVVNLRHQLDT